MSNVEQNWLNHKPKINTSRIDTFFFSSGNYSYEFEHCNKSSTLGRRSDRSGGTMNAVVG